MVSPLRAFLLVLAALLLAACGNPVPRPEAPASYQLKNKFNQAEVEPYLGEGTASLIGQGVMFDDTGDRQFASGRMVYLLPVTDYNRELIAAAWAGRPFAPVDPRNRDGVRMAVANPGGRFRFEKLPAGDYFVVTWVRWSQEQNRSRPKGESRIRWTSEGGMVGAQVHLEEGQQANILVYEPDLMKTVFKAANP